MTKISTYPIDTDVTGSDKWIGTDTDTYNKTKNFTPIKLAKYFNNSETISVGMTLRYVYDILEVGEARKYGTITFNPQQGPNVPFSSISTFILSKFTTGGKDVEQYLQKLPGSQVAICNSDNPNSFGIFDITSVTQIILEPNFYEVELTFVDGNGSLVEDKAYSVELIRFGQNTSGGVQSVSGNIVDNTDPLNPVVDQVQPDWDATSGLGEILNKPTIPTKTSDLTNDGEDGVNPFISQEQVVEYADLASFPSIGTVGIIYIALDTDLAYVWDPGIMDYVLTSMPNTGITGVGRINRVAKFDSPTSIVWSKISEDNFGSVKINDSNRNFLNGNTLLSIQRAQTQMDFVLGNPSASQSNIIIDDNTIGTEYRTKGAYTFKTGASYTESFVIGSNGKLKISQTPDAGSTSDSLLVRDSSGNVKQIAYPTIPPAGVTSVGLTMPSAFTVTNSPITSSGDIAVTGAGSVSQYVRGDGTLANFPNSTGGGASVNYYLNGSVSQGTFGGTVYYQMSRTPILGSGTNFVRTNVSGNGYIASFITDAGDPSFLNIPGGNWNLQFYFQSSAPGGSPRFYAEIYKVSATNVFTLVASGSTNPEGITNGTTVDQYYTSIPVPQTSLLITDRLAVRIYVITGGRTITLHTENGNLCEVLTTFTTGLTALNGLTQQVQYFDIGTTGTDFNISSVTDTHTFNLPVASATNTGKLSSTDWTTFNSKQNALGFVPENVANKSSSVGLGTSNQLYPTQNAVKTYVDNAIGASIIQTITNGVTDKVPSSDAIFDALAGKADNAIITNISLTSTIVGWSSFTVRDIRVIDLGSFAIVFFRIQGTSNSTAASFTLPFNSTVETSVGIRTVNNGINQTVTGLARIVGSSNIIECYQNLAFASFATSGVKLVIGQILITK